MIFNQYSCCILIHEEKADLIKSSFNVVWLCVYMCFIRPQQHTTSLSLKLQFSSLHRTTLLYRPEEV